MPLSSQGVHGSDYSPGAVPSLQGFADTSRTAFTSTNWTSAGQTVSYVKHSTDGLHYLLRTSRSEQDQQVSAWGRKFVAFLRLTGGKAWYFAYDAEANSQAGSLTIGIATGIDETTQIGTTSYQVYRCDYLTTDVSGYSASRAENDLWSFSAIGHCITARYNGVQVARFFDARHTVSGQTAIKAYDGGYGIRDALVSYPIAAGLQSTAYVDLRDIGCKADESLTGSIAEGGTTLTLSSGDHSIRVGDTVIVQIGGEAGAGALGTVGVGGTWPSTGYADAATIAALADPGTDLLSVYDESNGHIWYWSDDSASWHEILGDAPTHYYYGYMMPLALVAEVTGVYRETITLGTAATVAATDAAVYVDCSPWLSHAVADPSSVPLLGRNISPGAATDCTAIDDLARIHIPAGTWMLASRILPAFRDGLQITGAGKETAILRSPKGVPSAQLRMHVSNGVALSDFQLRGNIGASGYVCVPTTSSQLAPGFNNNLAYGVLLESCDDSTVDRLKCVDNFRDLVFDGLQRSHATDCDVVQNQPTKMYMSWHTLMSACTDCTMTRMTADCDDCFDAMETFKCTRCEFIDCVSRNGLLSINGSIDSGHTNATVTIEVGSIGKSHITIVSPICDCNNNIGQPAPSGNFYDVTIVQEGSADGLGGYLRGVALGHTQPGLDVSGAITLGDTATKAVDATTATTVVDVHDLTTDATIHLRAGTITDVTAYETQFCGDDVTLTNVVGTQTDFCA